MTQIAILNGIYSDSNSDFRTSYPVNMVPVPKENGISKGYLRPADGIVKTGDGPGVDRGGINWNGTCYRVMGTKLVKVNSDGSITVLEDVGGTGLVSMSYSFDRLAIASGGNLFYWNGALSQVTDPDLLNVKDMVWVDGYFMTTDGTSLVVTELTDPMAINPLKYGSSEVDPDPINAVIKLRDEIYAANRYTIEVFQNVGGDLFPFARVPSAMIPKGCIGTHACCLYMDALAFVGGGRNEAPAVYLGNNSSAIKLSTREIDELLLTYSEDALSLIKIEARNDKSNQHLYVHLPDRTVVYDAAASQVVGEAIWFTLTSSLAGFSQYRAHNFVRCYDKWIVGSPVEAFIGHFDSSTGHHWEDPIRWEFGTTIVYNGGMGGIFHELELVALTGNVELGKNPRISTSYSVDGQTWSQDKYKAVGSIGDRSKRLVWWQQGHMKNWRVQRFRGDSYSHLSFARLEARLEPLAV